MLLPTHNAQTAG